MIDAFHIAVAGSRENVEHELRNAAPCQVLLFQATLAQLDGDIPSAKRLLKLLLTRATGIQRAIAADILAPLLVMHHDTKAVSALADILETEGWTASAHAFRAVVYANIGNRDAARRSVRLAHASLESESDDIIRLRVTQRLALAAFYLAEYSNALNLAQASAMISSNVGAWNSAVSAYSIGYAINHNVTGDFHEAKRYAHLLYKAAQRSGDQSLIHVARVVEYTLAAQSAEVERIAKLEDMLAASPFPEQYAERFPQAFAYALIPSRCGHGYRNRIRIWSPDRIHVGVKPGNMAGNLWLLSVLSIS